MWWGGGGGGVIPLGSATEFRNIFGINFSTSLSLALKKQCEQILSHLDLNPERC